MTELNFFNLTKIFNFESLVKRHNFPNVNVVCRLEYLYGFSLIPQILIDFCEKNYNSFNFIQLKLENRRTSKPSTE